MICYVMNGDQRIRIDYAQLVIFATAEKDFCLQNHGILFEGFGKTAPILIWAEAGVEYIVSLSKRREVGVFEKVRSYQNLFLVSL